MTAVAIVILVMGSVLSLSLGRAWLGPRAAPMIFASLVAHYVSAGGQVLLTTTYYGGGDMLLYFETGEHFAHWIHRGPESAWTDLWSVLWGAPTPLPFHVVGLGESTGSMSAFSGLLQLFVGSSLLSTCLAVACISLMGKIALARALVSGVWATDRWVVVACLLTPSLVFWTSGILKESVALAGLGFLLAFARALVDRRISGGVWALPIGVALVSISKPYVFFPYVLATGVWFYLGSQSKRQSFRPITLVAAGGAALGGLVVLGRYFPQYGLESVVDTAAHLQEVGGRVSGGSNFQIVDSASGPARQLLFAPLALATSLFRPFVFEVRNAPMAVSTLETTALTVLAIRAGLVLGLSGVRRVVLESPMLSMAATFVLVFGTAVGLSTTNMGTLSRYRVPMMPFFVVLVAALHHQRSKFRSSDSYLATPLSKEKNADVSARV